VKNLMLRHDVVEAVARKQFHIYPVATIDEGIHLLTGVEAGERDPAGEYPEGSINHRVQKRLRQMARKQMELAQAAWMKEHRD
jgi:predicted ATP-dependent protease